MKIRLLLGVVAFTVAQNYDYKEVLEKSLLFYEAQRSGPLPDSNRIDWRGDSAVDDVPVGGYYDAGDHVKFGQPMAAAITQIAWGALSFQLGYESAGQMEYLKACLKWGTDYFIAAHTSKNEFIGQVGDGNIDHVFWGRPEDMTMERPSFYLTEDAPGSDLVGETAAALAASSMIYRILNDTALADVALMHAEELFEFANNYRGIYTDSIPEAANFYNSNGYEDELPWAAAWLAKATGDQKYIDLADSLYDEGDLGSDVPQELGWNDKTLGACVLLYELTGSPKYLTCIDGWVNWVLYEAYYTPLGMIYLQMWGTLRKAANIAHVCAQVANLGLWQEECDSIVRSQINYALGDTGHSYVVGFGNNPPCREHHRASSCPDMPETCGDNEFESTDCNPQVLFGALVGGPDINDIWKDNRNDYVHNEVALDYNAGFTSAVAYLVTAV